MSVQFPYTWPSSERRKDSQSHTEHRNSAIESCPHIETSRKQRHFREPGHSRHAQIRPNTSVMKQRNRPCAKRSGGPSSAKEQYNRTDPPKNGCIHRDKIKQMSDNLCLRRLDVMCANGISDSNPPTVRWKSPERTCAHTLSVNQTESFAIDCPPHPPA